MFRFFFFKFLNEYSKYCTVVENSEKKKINQIKTCENK